MAKLFLEVMKSHYCKIVFILSAILSYFLIPPAVIHAYPLVAFTFILAFSAVITCTIRNMKERALLAKAAPNSIAALSALLGLSALQLCIAGFCSSAAVGIVALMPAFLSFYMEEHALEIVIATIVLQLGSLYYMGCFKDISFKPSFSLGGGGKGA